MIVSMFTVTSKFILSAIAAGADVHSHPCVTSNSSNTQRTRNKFPWQLFLCCEFFHLVSICKPCVCTIVFANVVVVVVVIVLLLQLKNPRTSMCISTTSAENGGALILAVCAASTEPKHLAMQVSVFLYACAGPSLKVVVDANIPIPQRWVVTAKWAVSQGLSLRRCVGSCPDMSQCSGVGISHPGDSHPGG